MESRDATTTLRRHFRNHITVRSRHPLAHSEQRTITTTTKTRADATTRTRLTRTAARFATQGRPDAHHVQRHCLSACRLLLCVCVCVCVCLSLSPPPSLSLSAVWTATGVGCSLAAPAQTPSIASRAFSTCPASHRLRPAHSLADPGEGGDGEGSGGETGGGGKRRGGGKGRLGRGGRGKGGGWGGRTQLRCLRGYDDRWEL